MDRLAPLWSVSATPNLRRKLHERTPHKGHYGALSALVMSSDLQMFLSSLSQYMWIGKQAHQKLLGLFGRRVQQLQRTQPEYQQDRKIFVMS